jgi:hypothetical protein
VSVHSNHKSARVLRKPLTRFKATNGKHKAPLELHLLQENFTLQLHTMETCTYLEDATETLTTITFSECNSPMERGLAVSFSLFTI